MEGAIISVSGLSVRERSDNVTSMTLGIGLTVGWSEIFGCSCRIARSVLSPWECREVAGATVGDALRSHRRGLPIPSSSTTRNREC